jgi:signal transduction histidine kinase
MHSASEALAVDPPSGPYEVRQTQEAQAGEENQPPGRNRAQLDWLFHDIQHEVATIMLLAEVVAGSPGTGPKSRRRLEQLASEAHWLNQLMGAYHDVQTEPRPDEWQPPASAVRVDLLVREVLAGVSLTSGCEVRFAGAPGTAWTNRLCMWRALRNLLDNAFRAADGLVAVAVTTSADWVTVSIDDDGPGFGKGRKGFASLGLGIVQDYAVANGGRVEVERSPLGGCCVRLVLPGLPPADRRLSVTLDELEPVPDRPGGMSGPAGAEASAG